MMLKRLGVLTILIVLALMTSVPAVSAYGQISDSGMILVDPLQHTPVQVPIPDISLPVVEAAQSAPAAQPQGNPPPDRGQALATGSIWVQHEGKEIRINFNARVTDEGATGHIFWREEGQTIRVGIDYLSILTTEYWTCAFMSGFVYAGHETHERLCFGICDDNEASAIWNEEDLYFDWIEFDTSRGNLTIKP